MNRFSPLKQGLILAFILFYSLSISIGFVPISFAQIEISDAQQASAEALFNSYLSLEKAFDSQISELYSDSAIIKSTRKFPDGHTETLHIPPQRYKAMLQQLMPMAKAINDRGQYSDVKYTASEDGTVRIQATRYSVNKDYSAPVILLVGPDNSGKWVIHEEYSETQP